MDDAAKKRGFLSRAPSSPAQMSNDHFVAQTYLKHFADPRTGMLHAYRKPEGTEFPCWPRDVCREWDGDLNPILNRPELLGEYRRIFEPFWNLSVANILTGSVSAQDKWAVSGYMANLMVCVPAWRRVGVDMYDQTTTADFITDVDLRRKHGQKIDEDLAECVELLKRGELGIATEPDYIKALATKNLMSYAWLSYNTDWLILRNDTEQPFITSDNPVAYQYSGVHGSPVWRYLPITPTLCLRIEYDPRRHRIEGAIPPEVLERGLTTEPRGTVGRTDAAPAEVREINKLAIQCAETVVFSSAPFEKLPFLVRRYGKYRMVTEHINLPERPDGSVIYGQRVLVREVARSP
jgi:hypothetical protein